MIKTARGSQLATDPPTAVVTAAAVPNGFVAVDTAPLAADVAAPATEPAAPFCKALQISDKEGRAAKPVEGVAVLVCGVEVEVPLLGLTGTIGVGIPSIPVGLFIQLSICACVSAKAIYCTVVETGLL